MSSLINAYEIVKQVRTGLNEVSDAYVQGTDTTGAYVNSDILRKINDAQKYLFNLLITRDPHLFIKSTTLTGVSSVYTMPSDFYRLRRLEDSYGNQIDKIHLEDKRLTNDSGDKWTFYWKGKTIIFNSLSATDVLTIYYLSRCRDLDYGMASAGGGLSITLATSARKEADFYTGMTIENITKDWTDTITAYSAARVATILQTAAASDYYGLVSELPEAFHALIAPKAVLLMKESMVSPEKPTVTEYKDFVELLTSTLSSLFGTQDGNEEVLEMFF